MHSWVSGVPSTASTIRQVAAEAPMTSASRSALTSQIALVSPALEMVSDRPIFASVDVRV